MIYHFLLCFASLLFDVFVSIRLAPDDKDIQIALLRQQLRVLGRKAKTKPRLSRPEQLMLVALIIRLQLQTLYVLFFIELGSRRVYLAGCTTSPDHAWVTQQARQLVWQWDETKTPMRFLIHDRDRQFTTLFDQVFVSEGIEVVPTPVRAPKANAVAEGWVRSIRQECLDRLLILNQRHLLRVRKEYTTYYHAARPHQGINQQAPISFSRQPRGNIHCRDVPGGILHDYYRVAA